MSTETTRRYSERAQHVNTGVAKITMEDLRHIRARIKPGKHMPGRLHRLAWRQLQSFVEYKAKAAAIVVEYANPAYSRPDMLVL